MVFSARSRASLRTLSDVSSNFASSSSAARRASLSLTLLRRTSLRTELETETERNSVASIHRVLLPPLDDLSETLGTPFDERLDTPGTSCFASFSQ